MNEIQTEVEDNQPLPKIGKQKQTILALAQMCDGIERREALVNKSTEPREIKDPALQNIINMAYALDARQESDNKVIISSLKGKVDDTLIDVLINI